MQMQKDKILIARQQNREDEYIRAIDSLTTLLVKLNDYTIDNLNLKLTKEIVSDVMTNKGKKTLENYYKDQESKLTKSGISGAVKAQTLSIIKTDLSDAIIRFSEQFGNLSVHAGTLMDYVVIDKDGYSDITSTAPKEIQELFNIYAEKPEHFELHNAQLQAVNALNNLRQVTRKVAPNVSFMSAVYFYSTFFEMDAQDVVRAKEINYKVL